MQFETKRALLEYLGKNPDDRKLVDRMMLRGDVYREDWMYYLIENKKDIVEENRELKMEVMKLKQSMSVNAPDREQMSKLILENSKIKKELAEEKINCEYYRRKYEAEMELKEKIIKRSFNWIKQHVKGADWGDFYSWVKEEEELPF